MQQRGEHHRKRLPLGEHDARCAYQVAEEGDALRPVQTVRHLLGDIVCSAQPEERLLREPLLEGLVHQLRVGEGEASHMMPCAVVAALSFRPLLGVTATFDRLRRRLGTHLLDAGSIERGGILPSMILSTIRLGPLGVSRLTAILFSRRLTQLDRLRGLILPLKAAVR